MNKVIPNGSRILVISLLKGLEVIEVNDKYLIGDYSKSYRLNPKYDLTDLTSIDVPDSSIKGTNIGEPTTIQKCTNIGEHINDNITSSSGYPYVSAFLKRANRIELKKQNQQSSKTNDLLNLIEYRFQLENLYRLNLDYDAINEDGKTKELKNLIEKVNTGNDLSINITNRVNRVFSPITCLKKEHRKYLLCKDGYTLMEIEFKSSHVFHLIKKIIDCAPSNDLIKEVEQLRRLAVDGDIYEHVSKHLPEYNLNRQEAKNLFIQSFLYGMYPNRKKSKAVKSLFPLISDFWDKQDRRQVSIELQQSESKLLNNHIVRRIATEFPYCTLFTVFDSILIDENHFDFVTEIIRQESFKFFGFEVPITYKDINSEVYSSELKTLSTVTDDILTMPTTVDKLEGYHSLLAA